MKKYLLILFFALTYFATSAQQFVNITNQNILIEGRYITNSNSISFCYPGTAFTINFTGTFCKVQLKPSAGYFVKSIDGGSYQKFDTYNNAESDFTEITLAENLAMGNHSVKIMLISEGVFCKPEIKGFVIDNNAKLLKPIHKKIKIEFIGNSITCGYGVETNNPTEHFADSTSNFAKSFAGIIAKTLDAEIMVVARSGIGVYRNYNDSPEGSQYTISKVYENSLITDTINKWNFSKWKPQVVVVELGTNDLSTAGYNKEKLTVSYLTFIKNLRNHYPSAKIVLCNSPMLHYEDSQTLTDAIANTMSALFMQDDKRIYRFDFQEQDDSLGYGADYHPSAKRQSDNARYLSYFIETKVLEKKKKNENK